MKINLLLVVLLGLLALSYGFKIERRGNGGKNNGRGPPPEGNNGLGPNEDEGDEGGDEGGDDEGSEEGERRRPDLPKLIVGALARRIEMQLKNCDLSGFDTSAMTIKDFLQNFVDILFMECEPTGPPSTTEAPEPTSDNPPETTSDTPPARRELEDKVVRELLNFLETNRR